MLTSGSSFLPFCLANIFTSICLAATTTKQHISHLGSFHKSQIGSLTILFALGQEEEENSRFVSEIARYSLNYGCEKIQKRKVLFTDSVTSYWSNLFQFTLILPLEVI